MAGRRQGRESLAALLMTGALVAGCDMVDADASAQSVSAVHPAIALARDFLAGGDGLALIAARHAAIDRTFAETGNYPFEAPRVAGKGSTLSQGHGAADMLVLVLSPSMNVTLDGVAAVLGKPGRLPGLSGKPWLFQIPAAKGRYTVALNGDPERPASRVVELTAIRE
jgi:hypothetical protein